MYICMYVCMYICLYLYIYIQYIHIQMGCQYTSVMRNYWALQIRGVIGKVRYHGNMETFIYQGGREVTKLWAVFQKAADCVCRRGRRGVFF